jgi:hypothetical protein
MTTTGVACGSCGAEVSATAKFCSEGGAPITLPPGWSKKMSRPSDVIASTQP